MKILITGGKGQLGSDTTEVLKSNGNEVFSYSSNELNITDLDSLCKTVKNINPDIIINCAAFTEVDTCETDIERAFAVNALGAKNCAIASALFDKKILHISTDYIFDGEKTFPYTEYDKPAPISVYGKSKLYGEKLLKEHCKKFFILRVAGVYGMSGKNFVKTIVNIGKTKKFLKVVDDQTTTPTYTVEIARQISDIIASDNYGTYHATCEGECSWFEFTKYIFAKLNIKTEVVPCKTTEFPRPAKRPAYSVLENFNLKLTGFHKMKHWKESLDEFLNSYGNQL